MQRLEDNTISDRERLKLLNELCKTCSRHRVIPKSMHIPDCSKGAMEAGRGGFANVLRGTYKGRRVAIKVVRVCLKDDLNVILSVSLQPASRYLYEWMDFRASAERESPGGTSGIQMFSHCLG
jgi:hypothetical protein